MFMVQTWWKHHPASSSIFLADLSLKTIRPLQLNQNAAALLTHHFLSNLLPASKDCSITFIILVKNAQVHSDLSAMISLLEHHADLEDMQRDSQFWQDSQFWLLSEGMNPAH